MEDFLLLEQTLKHQVWRHSAPLHHLYIKTFIPMMLQGESNIAVPHTHTHQEAL